MMKLTRNGQATAAAARPGRDQGPQESPEADTAASRGADGGRGPPPRVQHGGSGQQVRPATREPQRRSSKIQTLRQLQALPSFGK